jgi:hypothetical protein
MIMRPFPIACIATALTAFVACGTGAVKSGAPASGATSSGGTSSGGTSSGGTGAGGAGGGGPIAPGQTDPRAFGAADLSGITVAAFTQRDSNQSDPQVFDLLPDLVPRAWSRWDTYGLKASDYAFDYPKSCEAKGISFVSGTTASVIFQDEVSSADFMDQAGRDASGNLVVHSEIVSNAYRASLASPAFRKRLIDIGKVQIDGGVKGLFLDEINGGYSGNKFDGNEGFDDHHAADFGRYLCARYAASPSTLTTELSVLPVDKLDCAAPDPGATFDYRGYLARRGAAEAPLGPLNPLARDWGTTVANRPDPANGTFVETFPALVYWQEIVVALRTYARETYSREILITSNGVFPFVDFQSVGLYDWNKDGEGPKGFDWVPLQNGHLDGTVSFQTVLRGLRARSKRIVEAVGGKEVPVLLFLDWPTDTINRYYGLPLQERKDYFRLYAAEAYSLGLLFSLPLSTTTDTNTATALGMMDFFKQLRGFYKAHADLYRGAQQLPDTSTVSAPSTSTSLVKLPDGRTVLHVVNHAYSAGVVPQPDVTVSWPLSAKPASVTLVSPDLGADQTATFTYADGVVTVKIGQLDAYVAVVAQ